MVAAVFGCTVGAAASLATTFRFGRSGAVELRNFWADLGATRLKGYVSGLGLGLGLCTVIGFTAGVSSFALPAFSKNIHTEQLGRNNSGNPTSNRKFLAQFQGPVPQLTL